MKPISNAVLRSSFVNDDQIAELRRWGIPLEPPPQELLYTSPEVALSAIQEAIDSKELVIRDTELDILQNWHNTVPRADGRLYLKNGDVSNSAKCEFVRGRGGEWIIPWNDDDITDVLTNGESFLSLRGGLKVYFQDAREVFYGDQKVFVVCTGKMGRS